MAVILIVDDKAQNRELLTAQLEGQGHQLVEAWSGENALLRAAETPPDLVLLDVMMPGIGGYETARQLKKRRAGDYLPVIFVTALADLDSHRLGLLAGADEFLTKPIDAVVLRLRVANLLALRAERTALVVQNAALIDLRRFKDEMSELIVHDLKSPAAVILSSLDYVESTMTDANPSLHEALDDARLASRRVLRLLANLLDIARSETGHFVLHRSPTRPRPVMEAIMLRHSLEARLRGVHVQIEIDPTIEIPLDVDVFTRVIENLLDNAFRYTQRNGQIALDAQLHDGKVRIRVANSGPTIAREAQATVFEKYERAAGESGPGMNRGLGLYFCRLAIEAHGGRIWIEEESELPTAFAMELPLMACAEG